jgi:hypothetical protein
MTLHNLRNQIELRHSRRPFVTLCTVLAASGDGIPLPAEALSFLLATSAVFPLPSILSGVLLFRSLLFQRNLPIFHDQSGPVFRSHRELYRMHDRHGDEIRSTCVRIYGHWNTVTADPLLHVECPK